MENLGNQFDEIMSEYEDPFAPFQASVWRRRNELFAMAQNCEGLFFYWVMGS
jgi:hypothetical protein